MRASDLVGARVRDADGADLGTVSDIRLVQDGPVLGTWGAAFRVVGLVVAPPRTGSFLGYERGPVNGPWLVAKVVRWLHRDGVFVPWDDVESVADRVVRVARRRADLPPVPELGV
jgi:sporulation protein YlmC with PRC-barrel domain